MISAPTHPQTVSIIIPVYNAESTLGRLLSSLEQQTLLPTEVILVNDGSTDDSETIARNWSKTVSGFLVTILNQENKGPATARNQGAWEASGDILVFVDSDCVPEKDWLEQLIEPFKDESIVGVQGTYRSNQQEWIARFAQLEIEERYWRMSKSSYIDFIGTYSAAYRRKVFIEQGGFEARFRMASGEDADFSFRLADAGYLMVLQPSAGIHHHHPDTLIKYLRQKYWRAYWRNLIYRRHTSRMIKDTYTPQSLKFQTILGLLLPIIILGSLLNLWSWFLPVLVLLSIFLLSLPFTLWVAFRDPQLAVTVPAILMLRTFVFAVATAHGFLAGLWTKKEYQ